MGSTTAFMSEEYKRTPSRRPHSPASTPVYGSDHPMVAKYYYTLARCLRFYQEIKEPCAQNGTQKGRQADGATSAQPERNHSEMRKRDDLKPEATLLSNGIGTSFTKAFRLLLIE